MLILRRLQERKKDKYFIKTRKPDGTKTIITDDVFRYFVAFEI